MKRTHRLTAGALAFFFTAGIAALPMAAQASEEGRRNTALGLGAAAIALLLTQRNKLPGIAAAAGAAYAYKRYDDAVKERHRWERYGYYDNHRYGYNYRHHRW